jgi:hypothetical protein
MPATEYKPHELDNVTDAVVEVGAPEIYTVAALVNVEVTVAVNELVIVDPANVLKFNVATVPVPSPTLL